MIILNLFSGYNVFTEIARSQGHEVITVDIKNYKNCSKQDHLIDFLDFDYKQYSRHAFNFIMIGFPCNTFSKASGGFHFFNHFEARTIAAHKSIEMMLKLRELLLYFEDVPFILENPTSAIGKNWHFKKMFEDFNLHVIRLHQYNYGHITFKQTDLFTNINGIWLKTPVHRVKGKNVAPKFDNLPLKSRQSYPEKFCIALLEFVENNTITNVY